MSAPPAASDQAEPPVEDTSLATIHVIVENVEPRGTVWVALCDRSLSVEGCPYKQSVPASEGVTEVTFENMAPGDYAVAGFQDLNGNGVFDKFAGIPREPYALSGAAGGELVPTFEDAVMPFAAGRNEAVIRMKHVGL
jgi:uncharacterized protein (DUF2141 family)